jgi:hypothetical protein
MSFLFYTSGSVGDLGGQPPRSTRPELRAYLKLNHSWMATRELLREQHTRHSPSVN